MDFKNSIKCVRGENREKGRHIYIYWDYRYFWQLVTLTNVWYLQNSLYYRCECDKCPPELCPSGLRVQILVEGSGTPWQCCSKYRCVNGRSGTIEPSRRIHCIASQFFCQNACLPTCIICTSCKVLIHHMKNFNTNITWHVCSEKLCLQKNTVLFLTGPHNFEICKSPIYIILQNPQWQILAWYSQLYP